MGQDNPVFIIGGSRTGSELLKDFIREYTEIDILPEMCLLAPAWIHTDFENNLKKCGIERYRFDADEVLALMKSGTLEGYFWETISRFDQERLRTELSALPEISAKSVLDLFLKLHKELNNKARSGAKFPVYYSHAERLLEWYPKARIIHTMRDPRAIYASQARKHTKTLSEPKKSWVRFKHFAQINIQFYWTSRVHERFQDNERYLLSRFEDFIGDPENSIKELCEFLEVKFQDTMLAPKLRRNSSFEGKFQNSVGFQQEALTSWRENIRPITARMIDRMHGSRMKSFGYEFY